MSTCCCLHDTYLQGRREEAPSIDGSIEIDHLSSAAARRMQLASDHACMHQKFRIERPGKDTSRHQEATDARTREQKNRSAVTVSHAVTHAFPMDDTTSKIEVLQAVTPTEDVVLVEDASDDEEDPTAVTVVDGPTLSLAMTLTDEPQPPDDPLSPTTSSVTMTSRCKRKSYDISLPCRSARIAQRNTLRRLGIIGNNGKIDENVIQKYADYLKELLPPDVLNSLMHAKGRAFWDLVAGISLPPH
ncbi:unnamed protein product [Urochloa humidicola]